MESDVKPEAEVKIKSSKTKALKLPMPDASYAISRPMTSDENMLSAAKREDELVRQGLEAMGLTEAEAKIALSLRSFQATHFRSSAQMIGGGITKQFLSTMVEVSNISAQIDMGTMELSREAMLREDRRGLMDIMAKFAKLSNNSILVQAQVMEISARAKNGNLGGMRRTKPGFNPLEINVNPTGSPDTEPPESSIVIEDEENV